MARVRRTFEWNGKRYYAEGSTPIEAERARERMKMELEYGLRTTGSMTVNQLADLYVETLQNSNRDLRDVTVSQKISIINRVIRPEFGPMAASSVTQIHVLLLLNDIAQKYSQNHVDRVLSCLNGIFKLGVAAQQVRVNPCQDIEKPMGKRINIRREATSIERERCLGHLLWLDMVILCGLRPGETAVIRFSDIHEGYMQVEGTKKKNAKRYVPLPEWLRIRIMETPHVFENELVCSTRSNKRSREWTRLKKELSLPESDLEPYCFRHSYVTDLENCPGLSQAAIKRIIGHSLIGTTDRYTHSRVDTCLETLPLLEQYWTKLGIFRRVTEQKSVTFVTEAT